MGDGGPQDDSSAGLQRASLNSIGSLSSSKSRRVPPLAPEQEQVPEMCIMYKQFDLLLKPQTALISGLELSCHSPAARQRVCLQQLPPESASGEDQLLK